MVSLTTQSDLRNVRNLPFCYICGKQFAASDQCDDDHVPPQAIFRKGDRLPLKLRTHKACNEKHSGDDENFGQLIGAMDGRSPSNAKNRRLRVSHIAPSVGGITNLDVDAAIWRWVRGCHAALYKEPLATNWFSIVSPFPRADQTGGGPFKLRPILPQHPLFVQVIKTQRMHGELDRSRNQQWEVCLRVRLGKKRRRDEMDMHVCHKIIRLEAPRNDYSWSP